MHAMQCNARNTMHARNAYARNAVNAMQCNRAYGSPSVRTDEVSQSFFYFFCILKYKKTKSCLKPGFEPRTSSKMEIWMYGRTDVWMKSFYLAKMKYQCKNVGTNVTDGQTSFSYFCLVSVQSHTVSKSVRPYGGPELKKKLTDKHRQTHRSDRR
jgi:hypothetical protein